MSSPGRAREIVRLAASRSRALDESCAEWLHLDERGGHEASAAAYLERTAARAAELNMSPDEVNGEIADRLRFDALTAMINVAKRGKKNRRTA